MGIDQLGVIKEQIEKKDAELLAMRRELAELQKQVEELKPYKHYVEVSKEINSNIKQ